MTNDTPALVPARLVAGMATVLIGALFLADSAGLLYAQSVLAFWPVAPMALGLVLVLQADRGNRAAGAVLLLAGLWLLLNAVGVWTYPFWRTWPYLLIVFGGWMLYGARALRMHQPQAPAMVQALRASLDPAPADAEWIGALAFMNHVTRQATGTRLAGGELIAVAGTCDIDLSWVPMARHPDVAIDVVVLLGRVTVQLPPGWRVEIRAVPLIGRIRTAPALRDDGPCVVIRGLVVGGDVSVAIVTSPAFAVVGAVATPHRGQSDTLS